MYKSSYRKSHALVIGINKYQHTSPLGYAVSDAEAVAEALVKKLGFASENIILLLDDAATRDRIFGSFLSFASGDADVDDRLVVFFAGHGHTVPSLRGEVGYLIPSDGDPSELATLLRWDDLTRNADLIPAKHVLFIMDACYGGLAVTRAFRPGAVRFLRDMMQRTSRQVLSAGKADETVADLGGPIANHSVFTGHLLEGISGKAKDNNDNLTANGLIAYVYQAVSSDSSSQQTPHYGYLHGDGDMVFYPLPSEEELSSEALASVDSERLVVVPAVLQSQEDELDDQQRLKELLSETKHKIQLHDFMVQRTREMLSLTGEDYFSVHGVVNEEQFVERLHKYEEAIDSMIRNEMLVARWAETEHLEAIRMPLRKLSERISPMGGITYLLESRWYPAFLLMFTAGIGALAGDNMSAFKHVLYTPVPNPYGREKGDTLLSESFRAMGHIHDAFKSIHGYEHRHTPRSDYLFKFLQPIADDVLFLGNDYETLFDRCEMFLALEYLHIDHPQAFDPNERIWTPLGRFAWKQSSPLQRLVTEAKLAEDSWPPLRAGLFGGYLERFIELTSALQRFCSRVAW